MAKAKPHSAMGSLLDFNIDEAMEEEGALSPETTLDTNVDQYDEEIVEAVQPTNEQSSTTIINISPEECAPWSYADRPLDEMGDISNLSISLKEYGQQEPILVRPNTQNSGSKYEIIFGNRRWRAAKKAKIKLQAICKVISDQEAAVFQKEENENRKELSNYARALSYKSQIDGGVFANEAELSRMLGLSKQTLNDIMAYIRVPEDLRDLITNYRNLSINMVSKLAKYAKDKEAKEVLYHLAPKISDKKVTAGNIDKIIDTYLNPKEVHMRPSLSKQDASGKDIYVIERKNNGKISINIDKKFAFKINEAHLNEKLIDLLNELVEE